VSSQLQLPTSVVAGSIRDIGVKEWALLCFNKTSPLKVFLRDLQSLENEKPVFILKTIQKQVTGLDLGSGPFLSWHLLQ
jgi:hypothetical protein